jgi:hypothetical protein
LIELPNTVVVGMDSVVVISMVLVKFCVICQAVLSNAEKCMSLSEVTKLGTVTSAPLVTVDPVAVTMKTYVVLNKCKVKCSLNIEE